MAKRFTDTFKWSKSWFMDLSSKDKLLWMYMVDTCNHAGIWESNWKLASFQIGYEFECLPKSLSKQVYKVDSSKYYLVDFVEFQYGILNENNRAHSSVISILDRHNLLNQAPTKPLISPLQGAKDKDKAMDKDKDKDMVKVKVKKTLSFIRPTKDECREYFVERKYHNATYESEKFYDFYESKGWMIGKNKMKNWHNASGNWNRRVQENQKTKGYTPIPAGDEYADL